MRRLFFLFMVALLLAGNVLAEDAGIIETLKFKDADIRVVLKAITQKAFKDDMQVNILVAPDIKGLVTVDLGNVNWQTALEAVLKTYDYGYEWIGKNIILVDTLENLAEKRSKETAAKVAEPLSTEVVTLNFAKVSDVIVTVQKMLTERGRLTSDDRTNTLVITDTQTNIATIVEAVESLDAITPQVLIEARVIETDVDISEDVGINWNISLSAGGAKQPSSWPFTQASDNKYLPFDFPSPEDTDFSYGSLNASSLSTTLEAILSDTDTKILSMPKIVTLDNNTAKIDVLTEDPVPNYTYNADTGAWEIAGYDWIKYGVSLEVTPQINKEGFITLTVEPVISELAGQRTFTSSNSTANVPIISKQTTTTKVMIKDGETLVIGGLIRDKKVDIVTKVPLLGDIPGLGKIFQHKDKSVVQKNLVIFITPTIVTPEMEVVQEEETKE